jgi:hypothetical protein
MSLLGQMKLQAQQALEDKSNQFKLSADSLALRNAKLKEVFNYWREFSELIRVIEPDFTHAISLPSIGELSGLKVCEPFAEYRYTLLSNETFSDDISHVSLFYFYKAPQVFKLERELGIAQRIKDVLWRYGIVHTAEDVKNEHARVAAVSFTIPWQVKGSIFVTPLPDSDVLHFSLKNISKLGEMELEMPFDQVNAMFLDELSKLLLGQESSFWKLAKF